jgi:hypothetical protein
VYGFNNLKHKTLIPQPLAPLAQMSEGEVDPSIDKWIHSCLETAGAFGGFGEADGSCHVSGFLTMLRYSREGENGGSTDGT